MNISQIITDYIMKSILTAEGDLVVRGAAMPEALAAVAAGQVLKSAGEDIVPAYGKPFITDLGLAFGLINGDADGTVESASLGFAPKLVIFLAVDQTTTNANLSVGIDDGTAHIHVGIAGDAVSTVHGSDASVHILRDAGNFISGYITLLGADSFTMEWFETGICTAHAYFLTIG